ncbi:hypothetical protein [uncultured Methanomethylovorans sp.]|uniref:hypothetical protein n=1 Tax=uncultured Methanomethylovorans sp. TaxID=183759 RepID=UPI002AA92651|nr:hypothetical protein [uncultured Methanomethylovorans sp.]
MSESLHYPTSPKLKEAYIGLLGMVCTQKRIKFSATECINAICERSGWAIDTDHYGSPKIIGTTKKAKNYLQILAEGKKYVRCTGLMFEICVYDASTLERITTFDELFATMGDDEYMSEYLEPVDELAYSDWKDVIDIQTQFPSNHQISEAVERVLSATPIIEDEIETSITSFNKTPVLYPLSQEEEKKSESSLEDDGIESVGSLI